MKCTRVRESLYNTEGGLQAILRLPHLLCCKACRTEAHSLDKLADDLAQTQRYQPPTELLAKVLAVSQVQTRPKEQIKMKKLIYVGLALMVVAIGIGLIVPGRTGLGSNKQDVNSILLGVAQAMESAGTVHFSGYGSTSAPKSPTGLQMMPQRLDIWISNRAFYLRVADQQDKMTAATGLDAETAEWWSYDKDKAELLVADLKPLAPRADKVIAKIGDVYLGGQVIDALTAYHADAKKSMVTEQRDGQEVDVITVSFTLKEKPRRVTERMVFEVDPENNQLLSMRQYAQAEGYPEELVTRIDEFDYDVPLPDGRAALGVPAGLKIESAKASIQETDKTISLVTTVDGREIGRMDAPRN